MEIIRWIENWYKQQCNGEWESEYGIHIYNVDNPGWSVKISVMFTNLEDVVLNVDNTDKSEDDWFFYQIKDGKYYGAGDPDKLLFLLEKFREIVESHS